VLEFTAATGVQVHTNGCALLIPGAGQGSTRQLTGRLLIDCMGNASPIVGQMRWGQKPDGICLVVGTCARGFPNNTTGELLAKRRG
jgi:lycopene cyclase CruP